jgi:hypothetical protein
MFLVLGMCFAKCFEEVRIGAKIENEINEWRVAAYAPVDFSGVAIYAPS